MYPGRVARASDVWDECDEAQGAQTPTELQQAPRQPATPTGRAKRYRSNSYKRHGTLRDMGTPSSASQCDQTALATETERQEAGLENLLQVNHTLKRAQAAAHRHLAFVEDRIAKYQAGCRQLEAQNQYLQEAILTLTADMLAADRAQAAGQGHVDGEEVDACSQASSAEFMHLPFSKAS